MQSEIKGQPSFGYLELTMQTGDTIITESDAMASMDVGIDHKAKVNGNIISALLRKFFGKEGFFINRYQNNSADNKQMVLTQATPGSFNEHHLDNDELYLQPRSYIASTEGVSFALSWAGFRSWFAGEGLFRQRLSGKGSLWYGAYGHITPVEIDGEYVVDSSHLVAYTSGIHLKIQLSGNGVFSSFFSGEGFVTRLEGKGTAYLQTRSL